MYFGSRLLQVRFSFGGVIGAIEGFLLARLVALLFAARPDNPVFEALFALTAPLVWPWRWLDAWARQPRFGARLELATLAAMVAVVLLAGLWGLYRSRRTPAGAMRNE